MVEIIIFIKVIRSIDPVISRGEIRFCPLSFLYREIDTQSHRYNTKSLLRSEVELFALTNTLYIPHSDYNQTVDMMQYQHMRYRNRCNTFLLKPTGELYFCIKYLMLSFERITRLELWTCFSYRIISIFVILLLYFAPLVCWSHFEFSNFLVTIWFGIMLTVKC